MTIWKLVSLAKYHRYFDFTFSSSNSLTNSSFVVCTAIWQYFSFFIKTGFGLYSFDQWFHNKIFDPAVWRENNLIFSFPAINSAVKIIFCISVVKKTDLGYVNKYIDATLIFYMYMPSYLQNAVEHPSREFHCMGMFRESNKNKWWEKHLGGRSSTFIDWNTFSKLKPIRSHWNLAN